MGKEVVVPICNGVLLSHKKNISESVIMKWMDLKPIIHSEVSHFKYQTNIIYECIYVEFRKMVLMNLFSGQQWKHRHCGHSWGRRGWDELGE